MLLLTKLRLQTRIGLLTILGMVLVFALMAWQGTQALQTATHMVLQERLALAHTVALHLDQDLERTLDRLAEVAASPAINLEDDDLEPEKAELRALYRSQLFNYVFLLDRDGLVLWTEPYLAEVVGAKRLECPHVQEALRTGQPSIACVAHALTPLSPVVAPVVPIRSKGGSIVGLLGAAIDPSSPPFSRILQGIAPGHTGYVQLVDENGIVLAHTQGRRLFQRSEHADFFTPLLEKKEATVAIQRVTEEGRGIFREVIAFVPLTVAPWGVAVEEYEAELLAPALELRRRTSLYALAALAGVLLLVWVTARSLVEPLRQLVSASERIAAGDLATPVPSLGEDEIGELGCRFEEMRERLARWGEELEAKVAERTRELSTLYAIGRAAVQSLELDEVLNDALEETLEVLKVEAGGIRLMEPDGETMTLLVHRGLSEEFIQAVQRIRVGEGISGRAVTEGKPVVLDVSDYPTQRLAPLVIQEGFQSLVSTPLVSRGVALGALTLGSRRPRAFPPEELDLLAAIGQHLGQVVEIARLFEETERRARQLTLVGDIARRTVALLDSDALLWETARAIQTSFGYPDVLIFLVDHKHQQLIRKAWAGSYKRDQTASPLKPIEDRGILDWVAIHGETVLANDVSRDPRYVSLFEWTAAELCVPIKDGENILGGINVESDKLNAFDQSDVMALEALADNLAVALRNANLFAERQRKIAELAALNQVGRALTTTLHLDELLEIIYQEVTTVMEADAFFIALYDREANELDFRIRVDEGVREPQERRPLDTGLTALVVTSKKPILIRDFEREKDQYPQVKLWGTMKAPPSWLGVPMKVGEEVVGVISIQAYRPEAYDEGHLALLSTIAVQAAMAIENARLYQDMGQRLAELSALFEVSGALRGAATVEEMLPIILDKTLEVVAAEAGAIFLVDETAGQMTARVARGPMEQAVLGRPFPLTGTITEEMLRTGKPDICLDLAADPRLPEEMRAMLRGGESGIGLPLRAAGAPVGMMAVSWMAPHAITDDEVRLLTAIADMAASAIHRASLFEKLQARVRELSTVYEVGRTITATLRIEDVLDFIVCAASGTLHAEASYLFLWDEGEERLVMRAVTGFPPELVGRVKYRPGEGLSGWVFLESKSVNVPDVAKDPRWKPEPDHEAPLPSGRVVSALVVPLVVKEKPLGVLGVTNKIGAPAFTESDQSLLTVLAGQMAVALENARLYEDVRDLSMATIRSLATAIDARDPYTKGHSDQVARLSVLLAREMGWNGADLEMLEFAAVLHDVGKIGIPDAVLKKIEPLTPEEWNSIHLHPYHSAQMVKPVESLQRIIPWIYHHQEWWDGTGYPDGLKGEKIPLASRIIAAADAFNAMTTERPYRRAKTRQEAIEELRRCAGTQFDPRIVEVFVRLLEEQIL